MANKKSSLKQRKFSPGHLLITAIVFGVVGGLIGWAAFAAPHKSGGGSSKSYPYSLTISPSGPYTLGEKVFTTTTAPQIAESYIGLSCTQNGQVVLTSDHANWSGGWYFNYPWYLGPTSSYTGGAADCTFTAFHLSHNKVINDAVSTFSISN